MSTIVIVKNNCRCPLRILAATLAVLSAAGMHAQQNIFSLPFYEPFPSALSSTPYSNQTVDVVGYANNEELGTTGDPSALVWTFGNSANSSSCARAYETNGQSGLEYPGLTNVDAIYQTGLLGYRPSATSTKNRAVALGIPTNSASAPLSVYASVLLSIETNAYHNANNAVPFFGLTSNGYPATSVSQSGAVIYLNNSLQLMISKNSTTPATNTTAILASNTTYLLVLRYRYVPGGSDEVDLWVDPVGLGDDASIPPPTISTTNNGNVASNYFGGVGIFLASAPPFIYLDEIRVATNWSGVTPGTPAPGALYAVTGGGAGCGDTGFDVALSGADANVVYSLYTNGLSTGLSVTGPDTDFGPQTATAVYTVLGSNTVTGDVGWMSGSASVSLLMAPAIASQPQPAVVASGELAAFSVTAAGGGETYQWYRNGAPLSNTGEFSGVQSPNLVIFPATDADVATSANGYYVVINNSCGTGAVSSTTNSLALDSPANLEWYGDGTSNLWDVATSTNWNNQSAVFHDGDNVIFDDNSPNQTITLASSYLSPSLITINGSLNTYVFTGPGALAGSGSILMNSANTLTLETPNSMTGGVTISNGSVIFNGGSTLGPGPITLAGGALEAANIGLVTVTNQITVTSTNSAIATSATGGQPVVISTPIDGVSGSLAFLNDATKNGAPTIELTPAMTFGLPVILSPGANDLGITLESANTSGSQIWNNTVNGAGEIWRDAVGGTTILNDTNNYAGDGGSENSQGEMIGTLLTDGQIGVGADSTNDINGNLIGALGFGALVIDTRGTTPELFASGGPHMISNVVTFYTNIPGPAFVIGGDNELTFGGQFDLNETNRIIDIANTAPTIISGAIGDDGLVVGFTATGAGSLYLDGANTFTGITTNMAGLLAGNGSLNGSVVTASGSALGAGSPTAIGTLTINASLAIGGNLLFRVNKSLSQSNDTIAVKNGSITNAGAGTLTVNNVGPALAVGDKFTVFSAPVVNGGALTVVGGGMTWNNNLAVDGSITAAARIVVTQPGITVASMSGDNLIFSGANAPVGATYYVLSSTDLALPLSQWTVVSTNVFTGNAFSVTNAVGSGSKFYVLKVP